MKESKPDKRVAGPTIPEVVSADKKAPPRSEKYRVFARTREKTIMDREIANVRDPLQLVQGVLLQGVFNVDDSGVITAYPPHAIVEVRLTPILDTIPFKPSPSN